ncbi:MAG TPA: sulfite exporter TauE/SafE family protein [Bryobacteraceae bacterium]|nr:sulfite exporter TauE/SafE family protein [Bryobacteraceae bacterium]
MKTALFIALAIFGATYLFIWIAEIRGRHELPRPDLRDGFIGLITNFFDTLGIGSYATTTSFFKLWRLVPDEQIPGTLNVGHTVPTLIQAFIYIAVVKVDVMTLTLMVAAAALGAWLGAGVVARWSRRKIQIGMGTALLIMAGFFLMKQLNYLPGGGEAYGLTGVKLVIAVAANAVLGALMTLGIGLYAPCMVIISLMGMNQTTAYPIMMGSCAFLMPVGSARFIKEAKYNLKSALGLAIGGIPGVLVAAFIVKEMSVVAVRWLVIVVVVYTAIMMLRSAMVERRAAAAVPATSSL